jgi:hypothetical protein
LEPSGHLNFFWGSIHKVADRRLSLLQPIFSLFLSSKDTPSPGEYAWSEETIELAALDRCVFSFSFFF